MTRATPPTGPDDIVPDAWLREALRHAPDADAAVPAAVREAILRQARSAAHAPLRRAVPAPQGGAWRRWLGGWLRPTRLGYSGAFVVLLVAGIWGLEGLDEQAREPLAPSSPEAVMADAAPAIAASAPMPATVNPAAEAPTAIVAAVPTKPEPQAPLAPAGVRPPAPAAVPPAPATAPPAVAERAAASDAGSPPAALKADAPAAAKAAEAESGMPAVAPKATPPRTGTALGPATQDRAEAANLDPLASLLQRATDEASLRWSVGSREGSVGTTQRAWLDALRTATAGRWTRTSAAPAAAAVQLSSPAGPLASLSASGTPGMLWVVIGADTYRAPLSEDALARFDEARSGW